MIKIKNTIKKFLKNIIFFYMVKRIKFLYASKNDKNLRKITYQYLNQLEKKDLELFKKLKNYIEFLNIKEISKKEKIKVGFVLYTSSNWSCDDLYKMFEISSKYDPYIIVGSLKNNKSNEEYLKTVEYFKNNNYKIIDALNDNFERNVIDSFDILFYLNPFDIYPKRLNITNLKLNKICIYIPYSFMIADREYKFQLPVYYLTWKYFTDTLLYKELMKEKSPCSDDNVIYCGFSRMDEFYKNDISDDDLWKIPSKSKNKVYKIIYAPHHSVNDPKAGFSTFDQNGLFMLELAKKYKDNTSWIVKPHPLLKDRIVKNGYFKSEKEYDDYLEEWNNLPNAKVVTEGTYFDIFKSSDTMILDSVSFLAEYQYVHKPLLFLTRDTQKFNSFGEKLKDVLYKADGKDFNKIEDFLVEVIFNKKDIMKKDREAFFEKYLDYYKINGNKLSSKYIFDYIDRCFNMGEYNERK